MDDFSLLKAVIQHVIDGIIIIDQAGQIIFANPAADKLFGYQPGELCGLNADCLMPAHMRISHHMSINRYNETGQANMINKGREIIALKKDQTSFPARLSVSEVQFRRQVVYAGVIHDLTLEKNIEVQQKEYTSGLEAIVDKRTSFLTNIVQTLEQAKAEVSASLLKEKEVNKMKTRFVSIASHEFRTPLSSIQLSASLIEKYYDRLDKEKISRHLFKIKGAVADLTNILNDFLSIERIESGEVKVELKTFNLCPLVRDLVSEMSLLAKSGQHIAFDCSMEPIYVNLDAHLIRHCLVNLIANAMKYSGDNGVININVHTDENSCCLIKVRDNGIGIPAEDCAQIFQPFFRATNTADIEGTGLRLNIVKRYVELMDGSISFESEVGCGTAFEIKFPSGQND